MKNLNKLSFILGIGTMSALSFTLGACGDDTTDGGTAGKPSTAGTNSTSGTGGSAAGTTGTSGSGGTSAGTTGTSGSGGSSAGAAGKGGSGGSGGASGGSGGSAGSGGSGGASGGSGGSGGGGAGAPSADCKKWCEGDMGLIGKCIDGADKSPTLNPLVDTVAKCEAHCTGGKAGDANGLSCWIKHTMNVATLADGHCGHASGKPGAAGECAEIAQ